MQLTNRQKLAICRKRHSKTPPYSQRQLAEWAKEEFSLTAKPSQSTISAILKEEHKYMQMKNEQLDAKRTRPSLAPQMENVLLTFVNDMGKKNMPLTRVSIVSYAKMQAAHGNVAIPENFQFSDGWVSGFMRRHGLKSRSMQGKAGSVSIDDETIQETTKPVKGRAAASPRGNVYNIDEAEAPRSSISCTPIAGMKMDKKHITVASVCKADRSDKSRPFCISRHTEGSSLEETIQRADHKVHEERREEKEDKEMSTVTAPVSLQEKKRQCQEFLDGFAVYDTMDMKLLDLVKKRIKSLEYEELALSNSPEFPQ